MHKRSDEQSEQNKKELLEALETSLGVVTTACRQVGLGRTTFYKYCNEDPEFKRKVDEIENVAFDFVESQLYRQIQDGNTAATIFWLKTKGKNRGYSERFELTGANGEPLQPLQIILPHDPNRSRHINGAVEDVELLPDPDSGEPQD